MDKQALAHSEPPSTRSMQCRVYRHPSLTYLDNDSGIAVAPLTFSILIGAKYACLILTASPHYPNFALRHSLHVSSRRDTMAMRPGPPRQPVGSTAWCTEERSSALQISQSEVEEFGYSARNELEWLNEHMADVFSENQMYVLDASNVAIFY